MVDSRIEARRRVYDAWAQGGHRVYWDFDREQALAAAGVSQR